MAKKDALREYEAERDFGRSGEPRGSRRSQRGRARFVIQRHAGSAALALEKLG